MVRTAADILASLETAGAKLTLDDQEPEWPAVIRWEEPPPRDPRGHDRRPSQESKYDRLAAQLRARPGEWALVYEGPKGKASGMAMVIRLSQVVAFPNLDYEATTRTIGGGKTRTYARYIGDEG